jgi:ribonuclease HI
MKKEIIVFADGSSLGNPGPGGFGTIVKMESRVIELGGSFKHTTNNRMEITAAIKALEFLIAHKLAKDEHAISIFTDSSYVINGITKWVFGWQKNNWITSNKEPVQNQEPWKELVALVSHFSVSWMYVKGHAGIPGNERVDEIATGFSSGKKIDLYDGEPTAYSIALEIISSTRSTSELKPKKKSSPKGKAFSYLSLIEGKLERHDSWEACEARVKGVKGTKFKKAMSQSDEEEIKRVWGVM